MHRIPFTIPRERISGGPDDHHQHRSAERNNPMNRLLSILFALLLCGPSSAQLIRVAGPPANGYDLTRSPAAGARLSDSTGAGAANTAVIETAAGKCGYGASRGIQTTLCVPGGTFPTFQTTVGTQPDGSTASHGFKLLTAGGFAAFLPENSNTTTRGLTTRFEYRDTTGANEAHFHLVGSGQVWDFVELRGVRLVDC